ncbi:dUTP diphosphatase [Halalkalibacter nanhaiisediminis]|uniref:Dimeric dUTPase (All-alpha-NTP-PPase superfamily) n=1 Tax=Halalkalibacter nanhaiisediminis TaxID=688079 RepID=A0A562QJY0_9BACI|nr:dUTP diphosphatase [Halalkalibacter nanhaiisediminis]TWI57015.1 dimeric dUTPase (all-alpha-NTP-PPase superfamily) [Halalkalibacter nanhaiisediminis]
MEIEKLFLIQKQLNDRIIQEHRLEGKDLFTEVQLAFLVELGELANETRCFKYWSRKPSSKREVILEEYVDGLHFVLTLGLALRYTNVIIKQTYPYLETMTEQFLEVMKQTHELNRERSNENYQRLVDSFLGLGQQLGFSYEEIEEAYLAKNKVNHQRQDNGY